MLFSRLEPSDHVFEKDLADMNPRMENLKKTRLYLNCFIHFTHHLFF